MRRVGLAASVALGLFLAATPFLRYAHPGADLLPHSDHAPRHGGQLQMIGDHHIELLRKPGRIEAFVSDAKRAPLRPARGEVAFGDSPKVALRWENHRLWAPAPDEALAIAIDVWLKSGERLAWTFRGR
jgi:hypothetical protein